MQPINAPDPVFTLVALGLLGLAPFLAVMVTSFAKLVVVMGLVRNALGLQQVPPNVVLNGLALVISLYVMAPVAGEIYSQAGGMLTRGGAQAGNLVSVFETAREPLRGFLSRHAQPAEREFFVNSARKIWPEKDAAALRSDDLLVLAPAFTVTELTAAFKIGFLLYLAFVVIDLVVANVLLALGMMMFSPTIVSTPLKLLLFVLLDGWAKLVHGLILTYQ